MRLGRQLYKQRECHDCCCETVRDWLQCVTLFQLIGVEKDISFEEIQGNSIVSVLGERQVAVSTRGQILSKPLFSPCY